MEMPQISQDTERFLLQATKEDMQKAGTQFNNLLNQFMIWSQMAGFDVQAFQNPTGVVVIGEKR